MCVFMFLHSQEAPLLVDGKIWGAADESEAQELEEAEVADAVPPGHINLEEYEAEMVGVSSCFSNNDNNHIKRVPAWAPKGVDCWVFEGKRQVSLPLRRIQLCPARLRMRLTLYTLYKVRVDVACLGAKVSLRKIQTSC